MVGIAIAAVWRWRSRPTSNKKGNACSASDFYILIGVEDRYEVTPSWRCLGWGRHRHQLISRASGSALRQTLAAAPVPARLFLPAVVRRSRPSALSALSKKFSCRSASGATQLLRHPFAAATTAPRKENRPRAHVWLSGKLRPPAHCSSRSHGIPEQHVRCRCLAVVRERSLALLLGERIFIVLLELHLFKRESFRDLHPPLGIFLVQVYLN
jgi:hypothetical protein